MCRQRARAANSINAAEELRRKKSPSKKAQQALAQFAELTGGQAYFPKSIDEVEEICKRIAHDLRNNYTIGYNPSNKKLDGTWREVRVKVNPPKNAPKVSSIFSKPGYYAPTTEPAEPVSSNQ